MVTRFTILLVGGLLLGAADPRYNLSAVLLFTPVVIAGGRLAFHRLEARPLHASLAW